MDLIDLIDWNYRRQNRMEQGEIQYTVGRVLCVFIGCPSFVERTIENNSELLQCGNPRTAAGSLLFGCIPDSSCWLSPFPHSRIELISIFCGRLCWAYWNQFGRFESRGIFGSQCEWPKTPFQRSFLQQQVVGYVKQNKVEEQPTLWYELQHLSWACSGLCVIMWHHCVMSEEHFDALIAICLFHHEVKRE